MALPRGIRNNNPLNIRVNPANRWQGRRSVNRDGAFEQFEKMTFGIRAAMIILRNWCKRYGPMTVQTIITRWAPPAENDTSAYVRSVCAIATLSPGTTVAFAEKSKVCRLLRAMAIVENGLPFANYFPAILFQQTYANL